MAAAPRADLSSRAKRVRSYGNGRHSPAARTQLQAVPLALGQFLEDRPTTGGWVDGVAISFGPFTLFPNQRRLERSGVPVRLGSRTLEVLLVLIERAPGLVSKG